MWFLLGFYGLTAGRTDRLPIDSQWCFNTADYAAFHGSDPSLGKMDTEIFIYHL